jgi:hypothetical protein
VPYRLVCRTVELSNPRRYRHYCTFTCYGGTEGGVEEQLYSFLSLCARRRGWVVNATFQLLYPPASRPGSAQGKVWTGAEDFAPTRIRTQDRPVAVPTELSRPYRLLQKLYICQLQFSPFVGQKGRFQRR